MHPGNHCVLCMGKRERVEITRPLPIGTRCADASEDREARRLTRLKCKARPIILSVTLILVAAASNVGLCSLYSPAGFF